MYRRQRSAGTSGTAGVKSLPDGMVHRRNGHRLQRGDLRMRCPPAVSRSTNRSVAVNTTRWAAKLTAFFVCHQKRGGASPLPSVVLTHSSRSAITPRHGNTHHHSAGRHHRGNPQSPAFARVRSIDHGTIRRAATSSRHNHRSHCPAPCKGCTPPHPRQSAIAGNHPRRLTIRRRFSSMLRPIEVTPRPQIGQERDPAGTGLNKSPLRRARELDTAGRLFLRVTLLL